MHKHKLLLYAGLLLIMAAMLLTALQIFCDKEPPRVVVAFPERIAPGQPLGAVVSDAESGLGAVSVTAAQAGASPQIIVLEKYGDANREQLRFCIAGNGADEGPLTINIKAADRSLNRLFRGNYTLREIAIYLDKTPPQPAFDVQPLTLQKGGSALLRFRLSEDATVASLASGTLSFPLFSLGERDYAVLLTLPPDADTASFSPVLTLTDSVGNTSRTPLPLNKTEYSPKHDEIKLSDAFIKSKAREFAALLPAENDSLAIYLRVNNEERARNYKKIWQICQNTSPSPLWEGAFMPMPGAARRSDFADQRSYLYNNTVVDYQVHLGLDYASVAKDKIPAANAGQVVFTGYMGIHGNVVMIDHGLGLHSLYSHLSEILAEQGQNVAKGEIIGRTGSTGMAGGDHLHYEMLVNGISVDPLPWFDAEWVENNINSRLFQ